MKNKQINKFLLMFFLSFTLFFSVSKAETFGSVGVSSSPCSLTYKSSQSHIANPLGNYNFKQIFGICNSYNTDPTVESYISDFNAICEIVVSSGYDFLVLGKPNNSYSVVPFVWEKGTLDVGSTEQFIYFLGKENSTILTYLVNGVETCYQGTISNTNAQYDSSKGRLDSGYIILYSSVDVKQLTSVSGSLSWDGESYSYKSASSGENDSLTLTDDIIANIHSVLMSSDDLKSKRTSKNKRYFIVYTETIDTYDVYFYPDVDLVARYFSVDENDKFDSYSNLETSYIELSQKDMWYGFNSATWYENLATILNPSSYWKYQLFRKYSHQSSFFYKWEVDGCNVWEKPGGLTLDLSASKIVYTSHDIGNMIVEQNGDEYISNIVEETSIKKPTLINSETGEEYILSEVPKSSVEDVGFWENLINTVLDKIFNLADVLLTIFGANVVTLIFAIAIKTITVLVSSLALIFRFISFILTLVAIPASSALLAVDVATNSSSLAFTGLNWGTHFIDGLNFIKTIQWNGLGLWTLFEVFVASLEVVLFVKIVRKHYRTL